MSEKIKLLQIIGDSSLSGAPVHLLTLVKGLDKKKFEVICACPPGPIAGTLKEVKGVEVEIIPMRSKWDLKAVKKLHRLISTLKPQTSDLIVHTHGLRGGLLGRLACIGPAKTAPKVVYTEHLWTAEYKLKNPLSAWFQILTLWILDLFTNKTIAVSGAVADFLIKRGITRREKVVVIYNGIEQKPKTKNKKLKTQIKNKKIIGFVGSLVRRKGVEYLIQALPELKLKIKNEKLKVIIVGKGPEEEKLKRLTKKLKIEDMADFKGLVGDLSDIYPTLDVYVQPSLDEAFGMAVLEAMNFGVPVVASNVGGLPELLNLKSDKMTKCGILVPPKNSAALSEAILKISKNKRLAQKIGQEAKKRAKEFTASKMIKETQELYLSLID